jgi:hypothetical protein
VTKHGEDDPATAAFSCHRHPQRGQTARSPAEFEEARKIKNELSACPSERGQRHNGDLQVNRQASLCDEFGGAQSSE